MSRCTRSVQRICSSAARLGSAWALERTLPADADDQGLAADMTNRTSPSSRSLGWIPDVPDIRDFTLEHTEVTALLAGTAAATVLSGAASRGRRAVATAPTSADLRRWCTAVEDQGSLGSCTANAAVGLVEYYVKRATGESLDLSRLFVYKTSRNLLGWQGDQGAYLRTAMQALVMFGSPPERFHPYDTTRYEEEPTPFLYALGSNFKAVKYFRLDLPGEAKTATLARIKQFIATGHPAMFGFTVYDSIAGADSTGEIPFPKGSDRQDGGHAVMAVGYDDKKTIAGKTGALLIRNSWGTEWGMSGYGWLPYEYVLTGLADDFWSIQEQAWVSSQQFA